MNDIKKQIIYLSEGPEVVRFTGKPLFNDVKRVLRIANRVDKKERPRKLGYFLSQARKAPGNDKNKEKIIRSIFGKSQQMTTEKFIEGVYKYAETEFPKGKDLLVSPETGYQTTQRMVPDYKKNKTIAVSLYGKIFEDLLKEYNERYPDFNEEVRGMLTTDGHFEDAAAFVRYSIMTKDWIHFDAFQTDYFNKLRSKLYRNQGKLSKAVESFLRDIEKREFDFYKTAVSYIVRKHPNAKVFTANTAEIVARVEGVRGSGKLVSLYNTLPKNLGFKKVGIEKIIQIFDTRPGEKAEVKKAILRKGLRTSVSKPLLIPDIKKVIKIVNKEMNAASKEIKKEELDEIFKKASFEVFDDRGEAEAMHSAFHQFLNPLFKAFKRGPEVVDSVLKDRDFHKDLKNHTKRTGGEESELWWANRGTIFEDSEKETILRMIYS